jgi:hypothetical protein
MPNRWPALLEAAVSATRTGVRLWIAMARVGNARIDGPLLTIPAGGLTSAVNFEGTLLMALLGAGASPPVAQGWSAAVWGAWEKWYSTWTLAGVLAYPSFAAFPAPAAPPTPNVPFFVATGRPLFEGSVRDNNLEARIKQEIGSAAKEHGAVEAVHEFAVWFWNSFQLWHPTATFANLLGQGPVPSFAPPYVPVGPVVGGSVMSMPGCIQGGPFGLLPLLPRHR